MIDAASGRLDRHACPRTMVDMNYLIAGRLPVALPTRNGREPRLSYRLATGTGR